MQVQTIQSLQTGRKLIRQSRTVTTTMSGALRSSSVMAPTIFSAIFMRLSASNRLSSLTLLATPAVHQRHQHDMNHFRTEVQSKSNKVNNALPECRHSRRMSTGMSVKTKYDNVHTRDELQYTGHTAHLAHILALLQVVVEVKGTLLHALCD
jgi:hypothetical protein